jgi:hypothetical protein
MFAYLKAKRGEYGFKSKESIFMSFSVDVLKSLNESKVIYL